MATLNAWLCEPLPRDVKQAVERLQQEEDCVAIALMPDVHLSSDVCVGTVMATSRMLYPSAVGGDIGCGMAAIRLETDGGMLTKPENAAALLHAFARSIPALAHPRSLPAAPEQVAEHEQLRATRLSHPTLEKAADKLALAQLGTLGGGNHFLECQSDEQDRLWLMVHTGSRGMGQAIRDHHVLPGGLVPLQAESAAGLAYLADLQWALRYAEANRRLILRRACAESERLFGVTAQEATFFACHHNYVRKEGPLYVHRKGAISAQAGELGIVPGSMGTCSYHVEGRGNPESLCSSAHGAGRRFSRSEAKQRISQRALFQQMHGVYFDVRRAEALRDEAPGAYKDIDEVMRAQRDLTKIVRRLQPLLAYKGC